MPVNLTNMDIGTRYALQEDFNNGFVGRDRQVVIQTDDPKGYRPVIMDGVTQGGKSKVALLADLTDYLPKNNPAFTGTLSGANGTFTGALSLNGDSVATQSDLEDLQGQISDRYENYGVLPADASQNTYVTVQQLQSTSANLSDYVGAAGQLVYNTDTKKFHVMDGTTVNGASTLATNAEVSSSISSVQSTLTNSINTKVNKTGSRGQLSGYESTYAEASNTLNINENSPDCIIMTSTGNKTITVSSTAQTNAFCIKYVCCYVSSGTVTVNGLAGTFGGDPIEFGSTGWAIALVKSGANTWEGIPIGKW